MIMIQTKKKKKQSNRQLYFDIYSQSIITGQFFFIFCNSIIIMIIMLMIMIRIAITIILFFLSFA